MKILFFTYDFPYPTNSGGKMRAYNLMKEKSDDIDMYLFSFVREGFDTKHIDHLQSIGVKDVRIFQRRRVKDPKNLVSILHPEWSIFKSLYFNRSILEELVNFVKENKIDVIHYESYYTAFYISRELKNLGIRQILGTENIEHILYRDYIRYNVSTALKPIYLYQWRKIRKEEEEMFRAADVSLAVTKEEKEHVERFSKNPVYIIPNGVNIDQFSFKPKKAGSEKNILFIGNFSYFPNVDGIEYFYKNVFAKLNQHLQMTIIGKNHERLSFRHDKRVVFKEYVEDIVHEYHTADIFLSPIRIGGGTNFKILEAMSCGIPIIVAPHRIEGIGIKDGEHAFVAENPTEFANAITNLLEDNEMREKLAKNARELIEKKFSWEKIGKEMNKVWKNV